jgi:S1-C subfamily serine protease
MLLSMREAKMFAGARRTAGLAIFLLAVTVGPAICADPVRENPPEASVVFIQAGFQGDNNTFVQVEEGSGFIVESSGWVVTASHVLNADVPVNKTRVYFGSVRSRYGDRYELFPVPGPVVSSDFGLLRFSPALGKSWPALKVISNHQVSVSDTVTAIGFPIGMEITSRKGNVTNTFGPNGAIGTNAGLAPGMSGGPVVLGNSHCVVGIVTAGANFPGFDWFTPTTLAKPLLDVPPAQFVIEDGIHPPVCDDSRAQLNRAGAMPATPEEFENLIKACALDNNVTINAKLQGSLKTLFEGDRTNGFATFKSSSNYLQQFSQSDRLVAYQLYKDCIIRILGIPPN